MGYYTHIYGEMTVSPPLTYPEIKQWHAKHPPGEDDSLKLKTLSEPIDTDEGVLTRTTGVALVPYDESFRAYDFEKLVTEFVQMFACEGRTFTGRFEAEGENNEDMWRLEVVNGKPVKTKAWVVWPEDLNALRNAWSMSRPTGDADTDAGRFDVLHAAVTEFFDRAHRAGKGKNA